MKMDYLWNKWNSVPPFQRIFQSIIHRKAVRLLGVSVTNLSLCYQLPLFEEEGKRLRISRAMDRINDRWGEFTITWAGLLDRSRGKGIISPRWRPEESYMPTGLDSSRK